jgi:hypothetical protein
MRLSAGYFGYHEAAVPDPAAALQGSGTGGGGAGESIPFDIDSHITEIDTGKVDADDMNSRVAESLKKLQSGDGYLAFGPSRHFLVVQRQGRRSDRPGSQSLRKLATLQ